MTESGAFQSSPDLLQCCISDSTIHARLQLGQSGLCRLSSGTSQLSARAAASPPYRTVAASVKAEQRSWVVKRLKQLNCPALWMCDRVSAERSADVGTDYESYVWFIWNILRPLMSICRVFTSLTNISTGWESAYRDKMVSVNHKTRSLQAFCADGFVFCPLSTLCPSSFLREALLTPTFLDHRRTGSVRLSNSTHWSWEQHYNTAQVQISLCSLTLPWAEWD